jgi:HAD superfamily hydrolase (TIGR01509 family)
VIKGVIFDMDGVLIEAKDWHYEALNRALALFGYEISRYAHLTVYDGLPTKKKLEMLSRETNLPVGLHSFINEMKQIYTMEMVHTKCKPLFVHEYALAALKAKGYKLAVASNSIAQTVDVMMKKASLDIYLDQILSATDVTLPKPNPEIYITAIQRLGLKNSECLVVEDNENGLKAARDAGAHVLQVSEVSEVNLQNIENRIREIEAAEAL